MPAPISFAATSAPLLAREKTRTLRKWKGLRGHSAGDIVKAYDQSPRFGGNHIANIAITNVQMVYPNEAGRWPPFLDYQVASVSEGLRWMELQGLLCSGIPPRDYYNRILESGARFLVVIDFQLMKSFVDVKEYLRAP